MVERNRLAARVADLRTRFVASLADPMLREGVRDCIPMAIGVSAWGLVAGVAMAKSGMGVPLAILMSLTVYAGSAQVAVLPLIASDAPMWVVWATAACVSLRFLVYSFYYRPYFAHLPRRRRIVLSYFMGDTNFAMFVRRFPEPKYAPGQEAYFIGAAVLNYFSWQIAIVTGILAGDAIPQSWGLGFAGTMALLALTCGQLRSPSTFFAALAASFAAVVCYGLPLRMNIIVAIAVAIGVGVLAHKIRRRRMKHATPASNAAPDDLD